MNNPSKEAKKAAEDLHNEYYTEEGTALFLDGLMQPLRAEIERLKRMFYEVRILTMLGSDRFNQERADNGSDRTSVSVWDDVEAIAKEHYVAVSKRMIDKPVD